MKINIEGLEIETEDSEELTGYARKLCESDEELGEEFNDVYSSIVEE